MHEHGGEVSHQYTYVYVYQHMRALPGPEVVLQGTPSQGYSQHVEAQVLD